VSFIKDRWYKVRDWWRRVWGNLRPGPEARKGAVWGVVVAAAGAAVVGGYSLKSGFGPLVDFGFAFVMAALAIPLVAVVFALLLTILRKLPRLASGFIFGACLFIALLWPPPLGIIMALIFGLVEGILGATIATFLIGDFGAAARSKKAVTVVLCFAAFAANVGLAVFLS
jgi:hypothetical protein